MKVGLGLHKSRIYVRSHNRGRRPQLDAFSSDGRWFHRNSQICYLAQTAYFVRAPHRVKKPKRSRVCDVEGGAVCSKNSTSGYFDGTAWTLRFRSLTPIIAPGYVYC